MENTKECKAYIGAKIILATPMKQGEFIYKIKNQVSTIKEDNQDGYMVIYPDGYKSWSPKAVFENAYRLVSDSEKLITK